MIQFEKVSKSFGNNSVLSEISLDISGPGVVAILGPNGSGKTTLIKSFLGMVIPDKGAIYWDNENLLRKYSYRSRIGYIPQIAHYPENLTVNELLTLISGFRYKDIDARPLIKEFRLQPYLGKRLGTLSGGTLQKVSIVQALMMDCELYIMDEPTTGLDPLSLNTFKSLVNKLVDKGKTLILTTHIMSLVEELATEIIYLLDGTVYFQGSPERLKQERSQRTIEGAIADILKEKEETQLEKLNKSYV